MQLPKKYNYKHRRYLAALLILLAVAFSAITIGQLGSPVTPVSPGHPPLNSPAIRRFPSGAVPTSPGRSAGAGLVGPIVRRAVKSDTSPPLRSIKPLSPNNRVRHEEKEEPSLVPGRITNGMVVDPVIQNWLGPLTMPTPIVNFEGLSNLNNAIPPDTNGDVGPNHYVQMVNSSFQIWDKSGNSLYGPGDNVTLWSGFGGLCETGTDSDPIVLYDPLANRWLLTQLVFADPSNPSQSHQCFAISTTPDPTASYHRYDFSTAGPNQDLLGDYPHLGVWPDGYYMTTNQFRSGGSAYAGAGNYVFERDKMLIGDPAAQVIYLSLDTALDGGMLPTD
jgi:hypothetical protein